MRTYASILISRLKIQFRIIGYYMLVPVALYLLVDITYKAPELSLSLTGYATQTLIFIGLIMGYHGGLRDRKQAGEYVRILDHSYAAQILSIVAEICFILLIQLIIYLYIAIYGAYCHQEPWYFQETFLYLLLYYFLPMVLGDVIGHLISLLGEKPILYFLLILIGMFVGPMGRHFWEDVFSLSLGDAAGFRIVNFISIGQIDIGEGMDLYYGLQIENNRFAHILMFIFLLLSLWGFLQARRAQKICAKTFVFPILSAAAGIVCVILYLVPCYLPSSESSDNALAIISYDRLYYSEKEGDEKEGLFRIDSLTGEIDTKRRFSFSGTITGEMLSDTDELAFRLYHDLHIRTLSGNGVIGYEQNDDTVYVFFDQKKNTGDPITLAISYQGTSSPYFYVNERAVFLPAYFNYLPCPGEGYAMRTENDGMMLYPVPVYMENEVFYDLTIRGSHEIYTNLKEQEQNHYCGTSNTGVYILSNDHMRTYPYANGEIVSCIQMPEDFAKRAAALLSDHVRALQEENGQQAGTDYRIILVPYHTCANTVQFEYADSETIYADAETWNVVKDYEKEAMEEVMESHAIHAVSQYQQ